MHLLQQLQHCQAGTHDWASSRAGRLVLGHLPARLCPRMWSRAGTLCCVLLLWATSNIGCSLAQEHGDQNHHWAASNTADHQHQEQQQQYVEQQPVAEAQQGWQGASFEEPQHAATPPTEEPPVYQDTAAAAGASEVTRQEYAASQEATDTAASEQPASMAAGETVYDQAQATAADAAASEQVTAVNTEQAAGTDSAGAGDGSADAVAADDSTAVATTNTTAATPTVPAPSTLAMQYNITLMAPRLTKAHARLFGNESLRDVPGALAELHQLAGVLQEAVTLKVRSRRTLYTPPPTTDTTPGGDQVATPGDAADVTKDAVGKDKSLWQQATEMRHTGVRVAAQAAFTLTVLEATGVLPTSERYAPFQDVLSQLHQQSQAGSIEATLALADRFYSGTGVAASCATGAYFSRLAGLYITDDTEKEARFAAYVAPLDMRARFVNAKYQSGEDLENAAHVVQMEEDLALRGNTEAQRRMAYRRLMGQGIEADPEGAFNDFQAGAAAGDPFAMFNLGYMYIRGLHVPVQPDRAHQWFQQAADRGFAPAWNALGVMHWNGQVGPANLSVAFDMFTKGVAQNQSDAMYNLAILYLNGLHVERNESEAFQLFKKADLFGHWKAAFNVALMHEDGLGTPKDCLAAEQAYRKFFRERANWVPALSAAAKAADEGDHWGALVQYLVLAEQGCETATSNAAWMLRHGKGFTGPGFLDLAVALFERAARQNASSSAVELGYMILEADQLGLAWRANATGAVDWFNKAAQNSDPEGLFLLGWAHHMGVGVPDGVNITRARDYYRQSIKAAGHPSHVRGKSVPAQLGLLTLTLDTWLAPFFGPRAATRAAVWVQEQLFHREYVRPEFAWGGQSAEFLMQTRSASTAEADVGVAEGQAGGEGERHKANNQKDAPLLAQLNGVFPPWMLSVIRQLLKLTSGMSQADAENVLMTVLLGSLAVVLVLRRRQLAMHSMQPHAGVMEPPRMMAPIQAVHHRAHGGTAHVDTLPVGVSQGVVTPEVTPPHSEGGSTSSSAYVSRRETADSSEGSTAGSTDTSAQPQ